MREIAAGTMPTGISEPYLAPLENGQQEATVGAHARLAKLLGVRIGDLVVEGA